FSGPRTIEQDAKRRDVAIWTDLLIFDDDRTDETVEGGIRQVGSFADRAMIGFRPKRLEAFALGDAPTGIARGIGILAADVDLDPADFQRSAAVDREDSTFAALHLGDKRAPHPEDGERGDKSENERPAEEHQRALGDNGREFQARYG